MGIIMLVFLELLLRLVWGFGTPILYVYSEEYEYIYAPNQDVTRLGCRIVTNSYSMRNKKLNSRAKKRILGLGDSVINGGSLTSHENLATTMLSERLTEKFNDTIEVLNVAAGSWGPDNAMAYINKHGDFDADCILLVLSSHDLYDVMTHENIVGKLKSYPDKNPVTAIGEVISRYLFADDISNANLIINKSKNINPGIQQIIDYCESQQIELLVYLHAEQSELIKGEYSKNGKDIISILQKNNIQLIQGIDFEKKEGYRDKIHFNDEGQKIMADAIFPKAVEVLNRKDEN